MTRDEAEAAELAALHGQRTMLPVFLSPTDCATCGGGNRYPCICGVLS